MASSLKTLAVQGAIWNVGSGLVATIIRLGSSMILARLLSPHDYGIMSMCMVALFFLGLTGDMGITSGIVAKRKLTQKDLDTAFFLIFSVRLFLFAIGFLGAPLIAEYFKEPKLIGAFRTVSFVFLVSGISAVPLSLLNKNLKIKEKSLIFIFSIILESFLAIILALKGYKYWALIIAMLLSGLVQHVLYCLCVKWYPTFSFSKDSFSFFKKYIVTCVPSCWLVYLLLNVDRLIVGRFLGAFSLGYYEFSLKIPKMFWERFSYPLASILFPVMTKVDDISKMSYATFKVLEIIVLVLAPISLFFVFFSRDIVLFLWGPKWLNIYKFLSIFSLAFFVRAITAVNVPIFFSLNRPDFNLKMNFSFLIFTLLLMIILTFKLGLSGAVLALSLSFFVPIIWWFYACSLISFNFKLFFQLASKILIFALLSVILSKIVALNFLGALPSFPRLIICCLISLLLYCCMLVALMRNNLTMILNLIKHSFFSGS